MEKLTTILAALLITITAYGQDFKAKAKLECRKVQLDNGKWGAWSHWETSRATIKLEDSDWTVNNKTFKVIAKLPTYLDADKDEIISWKCTDPKGDTCEVRMVNWNSVKGAKQLYIVYPKFKICYNLKK